MGAYWPLKEGANVDEREEVKNENLLRMTSAEKDRNGRKHGGKR